MACPRNCGVDRMKDETRVGNTGRHAIVSSAFPHRGEEDCPGARQCASKIALAFTTGFLRPPRSGWRGE